MLVATVESTTLGAVAYDESEEVLRLQFRSGAAYEYARVPAAVHAALLKAPSKGGYFNQAMRGHFPDRAIPSDWQMVGVR